MVLKENLKNTNSQIPYNEVAQEQTKVIFNTKQVTSMLSITAAVFNIRKRFEDICKECFKDHRELSKFVLQITNIGAKVTVRSDSIHYKLERLETPSYQRAAEKLIVKINAMDMSFINSNNKKIFVEFQPKEGNKNHK